MAGAIRAVTGNGIGIARMAQAVALDLLLQALEGAGEVNSGDPTPPST